MQFRDVKLVGLVIVLSIAFSTLLFTPPSFIAQIVAAGGFITPITIVQDEPVSQWAGVYGNITSTSSHVGVTITGDAVTYGPRYSTCINDQDGEVYFSQGTLDFSNLGAGNVAELDTLLGVAASHQLSATNLFNTTATFNVNGTSISTSSAITLSPTGHTMGLLRDNTNNIPVFVTPITQDTTLFNGELGDFQTLLPYFSGNQVFNISLDPGNVCPSFCGDNTCDSNETTNNCAIDCPPIINICGNGVCNGTETCGSCAADCGFCPEPPPVTQGGIEPILPDGTVPVAVTPPGDEDPGEEEDEIFQGLLISPAEVTLQITQGDTEYIQFRISNGEEKAHVLTIDRSLSIADYTIIDQKKVFIQRGGEAVAPMRFVIDPDTPPGTYTGEIYFYDTAGRTKLKVPVFLQVVPPSAPFFYNIEGVNSPLRSGEELIVEYEIRDVPGREVTFGAEVYSADKRLPIARIELVEFVEDTKQGTFRIRIPPRSVSSRYVLEGKAVYFDDLGKEHVATDITFIEVTRTNFFLFAAIVLLGLLGTAGMLLLAKKFYRGFAVHYNNTAALILEDQFSLESPALFRLEKTDKVRNKVLMIEARERLLRRIEKNRSFDKKNPQALSSMIISMRDFAKRLNQNAYDVHYYKSGNIEDAVNEFIHKYKIKKLFIHNPHDAELRDIVKRMAQDNSVIQMMEE